MRKRAARPSYFVSHRVPEAITSAGELKSSHLLVLFSQPRKSIASSAVDGKGEGG